MFLVAAVVHAGQRNKASERVKARNVKKKRSTRIEKKTGEEKKNAHPGAFVKRNHVICPHETLATTF